MNRRDFLASLMASATATAVRAQTGGRVVPPATLPPISWSCPMHPEVVADGPGHCPQCGMELQQVRLALVWSCPVHTDVSELASGACRQCGRTLVRVIKQLAFTCRVHRQVSALDPGKCPICKRELVPTYLARAHGDHNPKHGGFFFMPSNSWHVEVTHPAIGVFRMYVYDAYSKPLEPPAFAARIIEAPDAAGNPKTVAIPFTRVASNGYHTARIPGLALPASISITATFDKNDGEFRLDVPFLEYSKEPATSTAGRARSR